MASAIRGQLWTRSGGRGPNTRGWLPNYRVPEVFAAYRMTVHVPRRPYVENLPGIPTIRVFEALACGIPLICAPWEDTREAFPAGDRLSSREERPGNG